MFVGGVGGSVLRGAWHRPRGDGPGRAFAVPLGLPVTVGTEHTITGLIKESLPGRVANSVRGHCYRGFFDWWERCGVPGGGCFPPGVAFPIVPKGQCHGARSPPRQGGQHEGRDGRGGQGEDKGAGRREGRGGEAGVDGRDGRGGGGGDGADVGGVAFDSASVIHGI